MPWLVVDIKAKEILDEDEEYVTKAFIWRDTQTVVITGHGTDWGGNSRISVSASNATLYYNGSTNTSNLPFSGSITLTLKANKVSSGVNDIVVGASATDANGATASGSDAATACKIRVEMREKPWGASWMAPEDSGSQNGADWFHLWRVNENAFRAVAVPSGLNSHATDCALSGISGTTFASGAGPDGDARPPWRRMPSLIAYWPNITATVSFGAVALTDNQTNAAVQMNDIQSVQWEPVEGSNNAIRYEDAPNTALPEMPDWEGGGEQGDGGTPAANAARKRCFPEKLNPNAEKPENEINVKVTLAQAVQKGITATVHIDYFDPGERTAQFLWDHMDTAYNSGKCNNNGDIQLELVTLSFVTGLAEKRAKCTFTKAQPGDDYIVAAHPNQNSLAQYQLSNNDLYKIVYPENEGEWPFLPANLQTPILVVWRTLWLEIDQMAMPQVGEKDGFPIDKKHSEVEHDCNNVDLTIHWWDEVDYFNGPDPHTKFDVRFQPEIKDEDLTVLIDAMKAACVDVRKVEQTPENAHWRKGAIHGQNAWVTEVPFIHNIEEDQMVNTINAGRDIVVQDHFFWCILMVAAYEFGKEENDIINRDWDDDNLDNMIVSYGCNPPRNANGFGQASVFIFCEAIRDVPSQERSPRNMAPLKSKEKEILKKGTILHETLHCFGLNDNGNGIMCSPVDVANPNNANEVFWYHLAFTEPWDSLLSDHIKAIQKTDYPQ